MKKIAKFRIWELSRGIIIPNQVFQTIAPLTYSARGALPWCGGAFQSEGIFEGTLFLCVSGEESPDSMRPWPFGVDACESREGVIFRRKGQQKTNRLADFG